MSRYFSLFSFLFCAGIVLASAQDVRMAVLPRLQMEAGSSTKYSVKVQVGGSFNASVILRASSTTLPNAEFVFTPARLNYPYADSSVMSVITTGAHKAGVHAIVVEGYNGPLSVLDTVMLTIKPRPAWTVYDMSNSPLPSNKVRCVAIDAQGVAWIGTQKGLVKFDGTTWTLPNDGLGGERLVSTVCLDKQGAVYKPGYFTLEKFNNGVWTSRPAFFDIASLALGPNDVVWGASHIVLERFDDTVSKVYSAEDPDVDMNPTEIAVDHSNALWAVGDYAVVRFDGTYWTRYEPSDLGMGESLRPAPAIDRGVADTMYVLGDEKVVTFASGLHSTVAADYSNRNFPGPRPRQIAVDSFGTKWVVTGPSYNDNHEGLGRYQDGQWWSYNVGNSGLPSNTIYDIVADNEKRLWICTEKGLAILNTSLSPLVAFTTDVDDDAHDGTTPTVVISSIAPNPAGTGAEIVLTTLVQQLVRVSIVNAFGQEVQVLFDGTPSSNTLSLHTETSILPSGTYFVHVRANGELQTQQLFVIH